MNPCVERIAISRPNLAALSTTKTLFFDDAPTQPSSKRYIKRQVSSERGESKNALHLASCRLQCMQIDG